MNKQVLFVLSLINKLLKFREENISLIGAIALIDNQFLELKNDRQNIELFVKEVDVAQPDYAKDKRKAKVSYVSKLRFILSRLWVVGMNRGDSQLIKLGNFSKSKLMKLQYALLIVKCDEVKEYCAAHADVQTDAGISEDDFTELTSLCNEYKKLTEAPDVEIARRKTLLAKLNNYCGNVSNRIHTNLVVSMKGAYQDQNPDLYGEFHTMMFNQPIGVRHHDVIGKVIDAETGGAVGKARIKIPKLDLEKKLRGHGGIFYLDDVEEGTYDVECSEPNYHPVTKQFRKVDGVVTRVTIEMEFNPLEGDEEQRAKPKARTKSAKVAENVVEPQRVAAEEVVATTVDVKETPTPQKSEQNDRGEDRSSNSETNVTD